MSKVSEALGSFQAPEIERLRDTGRLDVDSPKPMLNPEYGRKSRLYDNINKFLPAVAGAIEQREAKKKSTADERSNEIIRSLTPEQRRAAVEGGYLLYQDDPYAMEALKVKTGRNAAFLVDDDVAQKIKEGTFRSREEMEQYRHSRMQEGMKSYAEQFGISTTDVDFQRGFNSDITERNISLYGAHDNFVSEQAKKGALVNGRVEINSALNDPQLLRSADSGEFFEKYFSNGLITGSIPSDDQAVSMIAQSLSDVTQKSGGSTFLENLQDRKITLHGTTSTFKELMGEEQWNNLMITAQHSEFKLNAKRNEAFKLQVNSALNQDDLTAGWEQLQSIKHDLSKVQAGEQMTPEREMLIAAEQQMQDAFKRQSEETAKALDKQQKTINKTAVIEGQFRKRISGDYVSTDYKQLPTNENTGDFSKEDMVNYANNKLAEIDAMQIPQPQKDKMKLDYLRADSDGGSFRAAVGTMVSDASQEWQAAIINGELTKTDAMDKLREIRNADPQLIAALYPENADLFMKMDMIDKMGINVDRLVKAEQSRKAMSKEQQYEATRSFEAALNNSAAPEISMMPAEMREVARAVFDAWVFENGNDSEAMTQVTKYLQESTKTFTSSRASGKAQAVGVVPNSMLQVTSDPRSAEQGKEILDNIISKRIEMNPWVYNQQVSVGTHGGNIVITDATGDDVVRMVLSPEELRGEYDYMMQQQLENRWDDAMSKANKRDGFDALPSGGVRNYGGAIPQPPRPNKRQ